VAVRAGRQGTPHHQRNNGGVRVVVLADTHAPRRWKTCPPAVASCLRGAGLILHAGDVCAG